MGSPQITVGALRISALSKEWAASFSNDLEDALRTATLPFGNGAVVRIRKINLGRIRPGLSRQALALHLEAVLARHPAKVVRPGQRLPEDAAIIVFRDRVEQAAIALDTLNAGEPLDPVLLLTAPDSSSPGAATSQASVLLGLIEVAGVSAPGRILSLPGGEQRLRRSFQTFEIEDHIRLWRATGVSSEAVSKLARSVAQAISAPASSPSELVEEAMATAAHDPEIVQLLRTVSPQLRRLIDNSTTDLQDFTSMATIMLLTARSEGGHETLALTARVMERVLGPSIGAIKPQMSVPREEGAARLRPKTVEKPERAVLPPAHHESSLEIEVQRPEGTVETPSSPIEVGGAETDCAGLWYLLAAIEQFDPTGIDRAFELPVAQVTLQSFARRLGIKPDDPAASALGDWMDLAHLTLPEPRGGTSPNPAALSWITAHASVRTKKYGRRTLWTFRDRMPFAVGDGQAYSAHLGSQLTVNDLIDGLQIASQRLIFGQTGMGWRRVASVPGRVDTSATHVDVHLDARDLMPEVRLAGLDIDRGWVPWLGRVVSFHYDYDRVRDFTGAGAL